MAKEKSRKREGAQSCRPDDQFVAWVLGDLTPAARHDLERHSRRCPECRFRLASFRSAGAALDRMFTRSPQRREVVPAGKLLEAILSQLPEQKLHYDVVHFAEFGPILAAATDRGLCFVSFSERAEQEYLKQWANADFTVTRSEVALREAMSQLRAYFNGRRQRFELPVDLRFASDFTRKVLAETAKVGYGQVSTYQDIARRIKKPRASRAVGNALGKNPIPIVIPCHRVVASGGGLGGFTGGLQFKRKLLRIEGIEVGGGDLFA